MNIQSDVDDVFKGLKTQVKSIGMSENLLRMLLDLLCIQYSTDTGYIFYI
jgi:hypothetical protein